MVFLIAIYRKLRSKVYRGLVFWLVASRSACGLTKYQDVLVSQLLADIVVQRDTIQLLTGLFVQCFSAYLLVVPGSSFLYSI